MTGSTSYFFERLGWRCLIVEPMPDFCEKIKSIRSCEVAEIAASTQAGEVEFYVATGVETLSTMEKSESHFDRIKNLSQQDVRTIRVETARLDDILMERGFTEIDFLTIDVEGHESSVLAGMDFIKITPRIVIIEDNTYGLNCYVKRFMQSKGYKRFRKTGCNDWYAKSTDRLVTPWRIVCTEVPIFLYVIKQKIKPYMPSWLKRKPV